MARSARIDREQVVAVAAQLADTHGLEQLTLASLVHNAGVWMHWDYTKQSVQPVPFTNIASLARSRLAELQAHLGPAGFGARQAMIVLDRSGYAIYSNAAAARVLQQADGVALKFVPA